MSNAIDAARDYHASVIELTRSDLRDAVACLLLGGAIAAVYASQLHLQLTGLVFPLVALLWGVSSAAKWWRVSKTDPVLLWRRDCALDCPELYSAILESRAVSQTVRLEAAIPVLDDALVAEPGHGWYLYEKATVLTKLGRFEEARTTVEQCLATATPVRSDALLLLAEIEQSTGRILQALDCFVNAVRVDTGNTRALWRFGYTLRSAGYASEALQCARRAMALDPACEDAQLLYACLLEDAGELKQAELTLRELTKRLPAMVRAWSALGALLEKSGQQEQAAGCYSTAIQVHPTTPEDHVAQAKALAAAGRRGEALDSLARALRIHPRYTPALILTAELGVRGDVLDIARDARESVLRLRPTVEDVPRIVQVIDALKTGHQKLKEDPAAALEAFERGLDVDPENPALLGGRGMALAAVGRCAEALTCFDKRLERAPDRVPSSVQWIRVQCLQVLWLFADAHQLASTVLPMITNEEVRTPLAAFVKTTPPPFTREQSGAHWFAEGMKAQAAGSRADATEYFRRAVYACPNNATFLGCLAMSVIQLTEIKPSLALETEGVELFTRSLQIRREPLMLFNYAQALRIIGRATEALRIAEELLILTPDDPDVISLIEQIREQLRRLH